MAARSTKSLCDVHATAPVRDFLKPSEVVSSFWFTLHTHILTLSFIDSRHDIFS